MTRNLVLMNVCVMTDYGIRLYLLIRRGWERMDQSNSMAEWELVRAIYRLSSRLLEKTAILS